MRRWPPTNVYVLIAPRGAVKIGASVDPKLRCKTADGFFGRPHVLIKSWHRPLDALDVETTTKKLLRDHRIDRHEEWFACQAEVGVSAVEYAIRLLEAGNYRLLRYNRRQAYGATVRIGSYRGPRGRLPIIDDIDNGVDEIHLIRSDKPAE